MMTFPGEETLPGQGPQDAIRLGREGLRRLLEGRIRAEIAASRKTRGTAGSRLPPSPWGDEILIAEGDGEGTGSDSLERLWIAAAVNEMFGLDAFGRHECLLGRTTFGEWLDVLEECSRIGLSAVTFTTSGSTGRPKGCTHGAGSLLEEGRFLASLFAGSGRVISAVPAHHIYGFLFTVLLPDLLHLPVVPTAGAGRPRDGDLFVSFPEHWRYLERSIARWPSGVTGVTSTAPCPRDLIEGLAAKGMGRFIEVYGSSETAGIGTREWPQPHYTLMPHWDWPEDSGPGTPAGALLHRLGQRIELMDGVLRGDRRTFTVLGRHDHAVQIGGVNVFPEHVARALMDHPAVREASVRLTEAGEGQRLKAFIVPEGNAGETGPLEHELRRWIETRLSAPERPVALSFGPALPRNALGKLADW